MGFLERFHFVEDGHTTRADALCTFIKEEIAFGRIKAGDSIPTIKELAEESGLTFRVARGVVERLVREGYVRSRPRVGTLVLPRDIPVLHGRVVLAMPDVDVSSYHVMQIADVLHRRMTEAGYMFSTVAFSQDAREELTFLKYELSRTPDLVIAIYAPPHVRSFLRGTGTSCIFTYGDQPEEGLEDRWIRFSADEALANFAAHCKREEVRSVIEVRFEGNECPDAQPALAAEGIDSIRMTIPCRRELGRCEGIERSAYETFLAMPYREFPDLFLFWDDFVAQGALTAFLKRRVHIPDDVKIVALSNKGLGPVYTDSLTRFECDAADTGEKIAAFAQSVLSKGRLPPPPVIKPLYVFGRTFPYSP